MKKNLAGEEKRMSDLISRQYAIKHYQYVCRRTNCKECPLHIQVTDTLTDCELELFLHNLPSAQPEVDAVEVVRCKDCKFNNRCLLQHFVRDNAVEAITGEWFCADGRRSE